MALAAFRKAIFSLLLPLGTLLDNTFTIIREVNFYSDLISVRNFGGFYLGRKEVFCSDWLDVMLYTLACVGLNGLVAIVLFFSFLWLNFFIPILLNQVCKMKLKNVKMAF